MTLRKKKEKNRNARIASASDRANYARNNFNEAGARHKGLQIQSLLAREREMTRRRAFVITTNLRA